MKLLFACLSVVSLAHGGIIDTNAYGSGGGSGGGDSGGGYGSGSSGYGGGKQCTPYYDTVQSERCEAYTERVCTTTQKESCQDIGDQNCRGVVSSKQVRKCFDVTEQRCGLKEDVQFETIQVPYVVQKCQSVNERVCDTVYETSTTIKEDVQCINVDKPVCQNQDKTVYDVTCRTTTTFDCDTSAGGYGGGNNGDGGNAGAYGSDDAYGSNSYRNNAPASYGSGAASGAASGASGYGAPAQPICRRKQDTKCYKTPRTVTTQICSRGTEKVCEKLTLAVPFVQARQSCRNEPKKVCDLEERTQPKQVKRYTYSVQCKDSPRQVCDNADEKALVPSCVPTTRKQCTYTPIEQCVDEPKKHCFQFSTQVRKERCDFGAASGSSGAGSGSGSYPGGAPNY